MRISRIEAVLRNSTARNPNVKQATDDFITVIGNRYGEFTEQLAKFLEELERSGLIRKDDNVTMLILQIYLD
jgi:hypothetical protein